MLSRPESSALLDRIEATTAAAVSAARSQDHLEAAAHLAARIVDLQRLREVFPDLGAAPAPVQARVARIQEADVELAALVRGQKRDLTGTHPAAVAQGYHEGFAPAAVLSRRA